MSWQTIYNNVTGALWLQMQTLGRLQEQVATGSRVNRASDDPVASHQIMSLTTDYDSFSTYLKNIGSVVTDMEQVSASLQQVDDALIRAKQLLTQAASQTYNPSNIKSIGEELNSMLEEVVSAANTRTMGHYLFGASDSASAPYELQRDSDGKITSVTYVGSTHSSMVSVAPGVRQVGTMVGDEVFRCDARQDPVFMGNTGVQAGTGTSSARGDVWLTVIHGLTTYAGATGVAAGASSAGRDTIAGSGHTLRIDADNHKVRLDGGEWVEFTGASDDLKLANSNGDVAYVDMSDLDGGLAGTVDVAMNATAKLSTDDGLSTTDATMAQQGVTDSRTGRILYVDTGSLTRTGVEPVRVPGTYNLFDMLINARDILLQARPIASSSWTDVLNRSIDSLSEVYSGIVTQTAMVGARQQAMDTLKESLGSMQEIAHAQMAGIQDADITELAIELAKVQNFYQLTLSSAAKVMNMSLLDYIS